MDARVYEVLPQFNLGVDQPSTSLDNLEKLVLGSPNCIAKIRSKLSELGSSAHNDFASKIAQKEHEEGTNFYRVSRNREKVEEGPNEVYCELKSREELKPRHGLPPRIVIPPWTQSDDNRILAMQNAASSSLPSHPEQPRMTGDSEQKNQKGGTPT